VTSGALLDETSPSPQARAAALLSEARRIQARNPHSSFDNIWHTLWLLEATPAERLRRSLIRGRSSLFSDKEARFLQTLVDEGVEFLAVGLAAAALQGGGSFGREVRRAVRIPIGAVEVLVLPLSRIIASKKATGRPKDRAILPALEDALRVLQRRKRSARTARVRRRRGRR